MSRRAITRAEYEAAICKGVPKAKVLPFRAVALEGWNPVANDCHGNVNTWVRSARGHSPVRGWAFLRHCFIPGEISPGCEFTAHSVVRDERGTLFDITPVPDERLQPSMRFIPHPGREDVFWEMEKSNRCICCPYPDCHRDFELT